MIISLMYYIYISHHLYFDHGIHVIYLTMLLIYIYIYMVKYICNINTIAGYIMLYISGMIYIIIYGISIYDIWYYIYI